MVRQNDRDVLVNLPYTSLFADVYATAASFCD